MTDFIRLGCDPCSQLWYAACDGFAEKAKSLLARFDRQEIELAVPFDEAIEPDLQMWYKCLILPIENPNSRLVAFALAVRWARDRIERVEQVLALHPDDIVDGQIVKEKDDQLLLQPFEKKILRLINNRFDELNDRIDELKEAMDGGFDSLEQMLPEEEG